jgi:hypothetical protein
VCSVNRLNPFACRIAAISASLFPDNGQRGGAGVERHPAAALKDGDFDRRGPSARSRQSASPRSSMQR